jgi:hypothetical protein
MLPPTPISAVRESRTAKNRNPKTQETEAHAPLSCKIHYSITRAYPRKSDAPAFFTDDEFTARDLKLQVESCNHIYANEFNTPFDSKLMSRHFRRHRPIDIDIFPATTRKTSQSRTSIKLKW